MVNLAVNEHLAEQNTAKTLAAISFPAQFTSDQISADRCVGDPDTGLIRA